MGAGISEDETTIERLETIAGTGAAGGQEAQDGVPSEAALLELVGDPLDPPLAVSDVPGTAPARPRVARRLATAVRRGVAALASRRRRRRSERREGLSEALTAGLTRGLTLFVDDRGPASRRGPSGR